MTYAGALLAHDDGDGNLSLIVGTWGEGDNLKLAADEELCDCVCGEDIAEACRCQCDLTDLVITLSYGGDTCVYRYSTFGDTELHCIICFIRDVPNCTVGDEEFTQVCIYCYKSGENNKWVLELLGLYGYYYIDIPIDENGCPVAGDYTTYMWIHDDDLQINLAYEE